MRQKENHNPVKDCYDFTNNSEFSNFKKIKDHCEKQLGCETCRFKTKHGVWACTLEIPKDWDLEDIQKFLKSND